MDAEKAIALLAAHQKARADEIMNSPPPDRDPHAPEGQVIDLGLACAPPPPPAAVEPPAVPGAEALASSAGGDVDVAGEPTPALLGRLRKLQEDRVETYRRFDAALDACRGGSGAVDVAAYGAVVANCVQIKSSTRLQCERIRMF